MRAGIGWTWALAGGVILTQASTALPQSEEHYLKRRLPAPSNAVELQLGAGYTQGLGNVSPGRALIDGAGAGLGLTAELGYRANPYTSIGLEGQYQVFANQNDATTTPQGLDANVGVTLHANPSTRGDSWIRLGTGYRLLWLGAPGGTGDGGGARVFHGFDLINARIGYDIRLSQGVAFAPLFGADLQTFLWEDSKALSSIQWGTFLYAGLQGRFDAGQTAPPSVASMEGHTPGL